MPIIELDIPDYLAAALTAKAAAQGLTLAGWFERRAAQEAAPYSE